MYTLIFGLFVKILALPISVKLKKKKDQIQIVWLKTIKNVLKLEKKRHAPDIVKMAKNTDHDFLLEN